MDFILEERVEKACDLFRQGYNCSQSVFLAYNDLLGVESTLAATISGPLGGGMGRLREVCGAVSGMSLIAGFLAPCPDPAVRQAKAAIQRAGTLPRGKDDRNILQDGADGISLVELHRADVRRSHLVAHGSFTSSDTLAD